MAHAFFSEVDWQQLERGETVSPLAKTAGNHSDATSQQVIDSCVTVSTAAPDGAIACSTSASFVAAANALPGGSATPARPSCEGSAAPAPVSAAGCVRARWLDDLRAVHSAAAELQMDVSAEGLVWRMSMKLARVFGELHTSSTLIGKQLNATGACHVRLGHAACVASVMCVCM